MKATLAFIAVFGAVICGNVVVGEKYASSSENPLLLCNNIHDNRCLHPYLGKVSMQGNAENGIIRGKTNTEMEMAFPYKKNPFIELVEKNITGQGNHTHESTTSVKKASKDAGSIISYNGMTYDACSLCRWVDMVHRSGRYSSLEKDFQALYSHVMNDPFTSNSCIQRKVMYENQPDMTVAEKPSLYETPLLSKSITNGGIQTVAFVEKPFINRVGTKNMAIVIPVDEDNVSVVKKRQSTTTKRDMYTTNDSMIYMTPKASQTTTSEKCLAPDKSSEEKQPVTITKTAKDNWKEHEKNAIPDSLKTFDKDEKDFLLKNVVRENAGPLVTSAESFLRKKSSKKEVESSSSNDMTNFELFKKIKNLFDSMKNEKKTLSKDDYEKNGSNNFRDFIEESDGQLSNIAKEKSSKMGAAPEILNDEMPKDISSTVHFSPEKSATNALDEKFSYISDKNRFEETESAHGKIPIDEKEVIKILKEGCDSHKNNDVCRQIDEIIRQRSLKTLVERLFMAHKANTRKNHTDNLPNEAASSSVKMGIEGAISGKVEKSFAKPIDKRLNNFPNNKKEAENELKVSKKSTNKKQKTRSDEINNVNSENVAFIQPVVLKFEFSVKKKSS